ITGADKSHSSEEAIDSAIADFQAFIDESVRANETVDINRLLDLNVNVELLFDRGFQTKDEDLNNLIVEARDRFLRPGDQQVALEKLWDAFERIKTYFSSDKKSSSKLLITKLGDELD